MRLLFPTLPPFLLATQPSAALAPSLTWCLTPSSTDSMLHCISTTYGEDTHRVTTVVSPGKKINK